MSAKSKGLLIFMAVLMCYILFTYAPVISGYFDDAKYVDGEIFTPVNGEYDFRKFSLNSSGTKNYTTIISASGFVQFLDEKGNHTINYLEWDKMTSARRDRINSSFMIELNRSSQVVDGVSIINTSVLEVPFYGACVDVPNSNAQVYIATPTVNETVEMVKTLKFK